MLSTLLPTLLWLPLLLLLLSLPSALSTSYPLHTSSRWILDPSNTRVKLRCIDWAAHLESNLTDGNGWWADAPGYIAANSRYFDTEAWLAGLGAMSAWARDYPSVVAAGVRNEMRRIPVLQDGSGHEVWYDRVSRGIDVVAGANEGILAVVGGTLGGTDFSFLRTRALDRGRWEGRVVWEYHVYSYSIGYVTGNCDVFETQMGAAAGYLLEQGEEYTGPLWVSEFGFGMVGGPNRGLNGQESKYLECLMGYSEGNDADWSI
ncbi:MAG: hypothetical protein MMC23_003696 [Stictis urceolatum]|nr:hypothetical protein [Stictis urceolata]